MVCIGLVIHFWFTGLNIKKGSESARLQQGNEGRPGEHVDLTRLRTSASPTAKKTSRHSGMSETYYLLEPFSRPWQRKGKAVESLFRRHRTAKETQNWLWRGKRPCVLAEREVKGKLADEGRVREREREPFRQCHHRPSRRRLYRHFMSGGKRRRRKLTNANDSFLPFLSSPPKPAGDNARGVSAASNHLPSPAVGNGSKGRGQTTEDERRRHSRSRQRGGDAYKVNSSSLTSGNPRPISGKKATDTRKIRAVIHIFRPPRSNV